MRPGMWTSSAPGDVDDMVLEVDAVAFPAQMMAVLSYLIAADYAERFWIFYVNGQKRAHEAIDAHTTPQTLQLPLFDADEDVGFWLEDGGEWADQAYDPDFNALDFEALSARCLTMNWLARPVVDDRDDTGGALSNWTDANGNVNSFTGLKRFTNVAKVTESSLYGQLFVTLTNSGGVRTVNVYKGSDATGLLIATGSRTGDGVVTLLEQNSSGVGDLNTVTVAYTTDISCGLLIRWPKEYQVHYSTSALSFPRSPEATVIDDGGSNLFGFVSTRQAAGTYNCAIIAVSDAGIPQTSTTATDTQVLQSAPTPPVNPHFKQGDSTNTVVAWTSPDSGYTYNVYLSNLDGTIDMSSPNAVGSVTINNEVTFNVPSLGAGVTGTLRVLVRSVSAGGVEEKNSIILAITYTTGTRELAPPPKADIRSLAIASRQVTVEFEVDTRDLRAAPVGQVALFVNASLASLYASSVALADIDEIERGIASGDVAYTVASNGWFYVAIRAVTIDGSVYSEVNEVRRVYLSNAVPSDVDSFDVRASRGG